MLAYMVFFRPYESKLSTILSIINEVLLLVCLFVTARFVNPRIKYKTSKIYGNLLISIILLTIVINWVGIITAGVYGFLSKRKRDKQLKLAREMLQTKTEESQRYVTQLLYDI